MNEIIEEIAIDAGLDVNIRTPHLFNNDPQGWLDEFTRHFAKRLIAECVEVASTHVISIESVNFDLDKAVMRHFGLTSLE